MPISSKVCIGVFNFLQSVPYQRKQGKGGIRVMNKNTHELDVVIVRVKEQIDTLKAQLEDVDMMKDVSENASRDVAKRELTRLENKLNTYSSIREEYLTTIYLPGTIQPFETFYLEYREPEKIAKTKTRISLIPDIPDDIRTTQADIYVIPSTCEVAKAVLGKDYGTFIINTTGVQLDIEVTPYEKRG